VVINWTTRAKHPLIQPYNISSKMVCYAEIRKAMYGLKESGFIANQEFKIVLAKAGYVPKKIHRRIIHPQNKTNSILLSGG
jgi:hypothetical protein